MDADGDDVLVEETDIPSPQMKGNEDTIEDQNKKEYSDESEVENWSSDESSDVSEGEAWIQWFCSLRGNEFFCEVDYSFIDDPFNLHGLPDLPYFSEALDNILDILPSDFDEKYPNDSTERGIIESTSEELYGWIHRRYIVTTQGLEDMAEKYHAGDFGECPRFQCDRQSVLPLGLNDRRNVSTVKVYCPKCRGIYYPPHERQRSVDGAFFGRTFLPLLMMQYPLHEYCSSGTVNDFVYIPTVFGFRIHESSPYWGNTGALGDDDQEEDNEKEHPEQKFIEAEIEAIPDPEYKSSIA